MSELARTSPALRRLSRMVDMVPRPQNTVATNPEPDEKLQSILAFMTNPAAYPEQPRSVEMVETHMSHVFIAGDLVYKMKKPIRLGPIDFTTLEARRQNCEREYALNQRLAPGIYLAVVPLMRRPDGALALGGEGNPVEWFVLMRRLDRNQMLDHLVAHGQVQPADIDRLCAVLTDYYAGSPRIDISPQTLIASWHTGIDLIEKSLTDPIFALPVDAVSRPIQALRHTLENHAGMFVARLVEGRIVDGHGDLRPEHVYLGPQTLIIDRLEFDERLRWTDPFDETSFLGLECERFDAAWIGPYLIDCLSQRLQDKPLPMLLRFYRCYRACLRARLSIEHMRDPHPRTPEKWPRQTHEYLTIALNSLP